MLSVLNTTGREEEDFRSCCQQASQTGPFPNLPILIFSKDPRHMPADWTPANLFPVFSRSWNSLQEGVKRLSPRSRRIIARGEVLTTFRPARVIEEAAHRIRSIQGSSRRPRSTVRRPRNRELNGECCSSQKRQNAFVHYHLPHQVGVVLPWSFKRRTDRARTQ
jgi:hypothetical protein